MVWIAVFELLTGYALGSRGRPYRTGTYALAPAVKGLKPGAGISAAGGEEERARQKDLHAKLSRRPHVPRTVTANAENAGSTQSVTVSD